MDYRKLIEWARSVLSAWCWPSFFRVAAIYATTSLLVFSAVIFSFFLLPSSGQIDFFHTPHHINPLYSCANWDGQWYIDIAKKGYNYEPKTMSSVAFFPAYPIAGRILVSITGLPYDLALTLLANVFFFGALYLLFQYTRCRFPYAPPQLAGYAVLALALVPPGFFFRMAYSDSLFLFLAILCLYGLEKRWSLVIVAFLIGLSTAARAVGVALIVPLLFEIWDRYEFRIRQLAVTIATLLLCGWGLLAYMGYQYEAFGNALAFSQTQENWAFRSRPNSDDRWLAVLVGEPIWSVYIPSSSAYWRNHDRELDAPFSLQFANPLYFTAAVLLILVGEWKRWLTRNEFLYAIIVLMIPYVTRSYDACMTSHARFATVAFPIYLVLGRMLMSWPRAAQLAVGLVSATFLGMYAALFAAWYLFI